MPRQRGGSAHLSALQAPHDDGGYNQADAEGFIKLNALRLRIAAWRDKKVGRNG